MAVDERCSIIEQAITTFLGGKSVKRERALYEKHNVDAEVEKCLDKIFLHDSWDVMTPCDEKVTMLEFLEEAVKGGTLVRLKEGVWVCCNKQGSHNWTLCFLYRAQAGPKRPITDLYPYLIEYFEITEKYHMDDERAIDMPEDAPKVLAVLSSNVSRTFRSPEKGKRYAPHVLFLRVIKQQDIGEMYSGRNYDDDAAASDDDDLIEV